MIWSLHDDASSFVTESGGVVNHQILALRSASIDSVAVAIEK